MMDLFNFIFFVGFVTYIAMRGYFEQRTKNSVTSEDRVDGLELALLVFVFIGCIVLPTIYLTTPFLRFANYGLSNYVRAIGSIVMSFALWLFWRSHSDLGSNWSRSLEVRVGHTLVQHGVYRFVRHPMYTAIGLFSIAQGMLLPNWLAGWSALATFSVLYLVRVPREEQMMCELFGDSYREYMRCTGRLVPIKWMKRNGEY